MSRLHRKCLVASTAVHGLLLVVLLVGAAFREAPPAPPEFPFLEVIPNRIVDAALFGGARPNLAAPHHLQCNPPPCRSPCEPRNRNHPRNVPEPKVELKPQTEPPPSKPAPTPEPKPKPAEPKPAPAKPKIQVAPIKPQAAPPKRRRSKPVFSPRWRMNSKSDSRNTASRLNSKLTPKTTIAVPGPGGEAFANYSQVVISIYQQQWIKPIGIEQTATVKASVIIARDGRVVSARITKLSGNRTVDESVEQVLQRVKTVAPFPEGATDATRTFDLSFELTPADLSG